MTSSRLDSNALLSSSSFCSVSLSTLDCELLVVPSCYLGVEDDNFGRRELSER